jgi:hypothetical protein
VGEWLINLISIILTVPIFFFVLLVVLAKQWMKSGMKATKFASDITTIIFIFSVTFALHVIFRSSFLAWVIIILIILLSINILLVWKKEGEVIFRIAFIRFWRMSFILFLCLYSLTVFLGIFQRIFL